MMEEKNISIRQFCKNNEISQKAFKEYLIEQKFIYKQYYGKDKNRHKYISFPKYDTEEGNGLFEMNINPNHFNRGKNNMNIQITTKGQKYFIDKLEKEGILHGSIKHQRII